MTDAPLERLGVSAVRTGVSGTTRAARSASLLAAAYLTYLGFLAAGHPALLMAGAAAAALFFVLELPRLAPIGRLFVLAIPASAILVVLYAAAPLATLERALASGLFLTSFIAALGTLRVAASASTLILRSGRHFLAQPPRRSYAILNVGASLAATVLLFGVINLFGAMISRAADPIRHARPLRRAMLAVLRGYAAMPAWSPLALPFALLSVGYPNVDWFAALP
jgi:hypothetical protein